MIALLSLSAHAAPVVRFDADRRAGEVWLSTGFADAVAPLTLDGTLSLPVRGRALQLTAGLTVPLLRPDLRDHRVDLGARLPLLDRPWDVWVSAGLREVSTRNDAFDAATFGTVIGVAPGYYADRWTVAAEAELWTAWATWMRTSDYAVSPGGALPYRGWSTLTAAHALAGVRAGVLLGRVGVHVRGGYESRGEWNLVIPPIYVGVGIGYRI